MYLSCLLVDVGENPDRPRPGRLWLRNLYHVHQRLCMAFPSGGKGPDDPHFLKPFRLEDFAGQVHVQRTGDAGFLFMVEELAMAGQHSIPFAIILVNNGYLGLIRQNQKYAYGYEHAVSLWYGDGQIYPDNVKIAEAFGGAGERVFEAKDLPAAFGRAIASKVPYLVDVIVDRECDCSMGGSIAAVREFV